ncbi:Metallo-dependent phosphatase-like protein [Jimgerdemannia flammicorona]|uniref:Metallo-dependent phosphatase-like protein n=2 Tax=Jimgerdemannia flammicorona TaxID=994334 RepID=A0A433Q596_9FUNG|nr:Metallo-dependent phosphatase-like protein [Jimgerdemannia flammicorona]RUS24946.1 Metallo-dependent phosphatase-like protein [Jimgerdemannia flammicorona]
MPPPKHPLHLATVFDKDHSSPPTSPHPLDLYNSPSPKLPFPSHRFLTSVFSRRRRRLNLSTLVLLCLFLLWLFYDLIHLWVTILSYKLTNTLFDDGWIPCGSLRKQPILFVVDTHNVQVVWEVNCGLQNHDVRVAWGLVADSTGGHQGHGTTSNVNPVVLDDHHQVYKTVIGPLHYTGNYTYTITVSDRDKPAKALRILASHTFAWHPLESVRDHSPIRVVAIADNQFGLKTFTRITRAIATRHPPPDLLLHAGDAVQNYPNLQQWQTDLYAPLTRYNLGQRAPIIYAHGNHDFDPTLEYHYTRHTDDPWFAFSLASNAIRFIVLDSNLDSPEQDAWLRTELASPASTTARFRVVVVHIPPFIEFWDPEPWFDHGESEWGRFVRDRFVPLFEAAAVDLVVSGHQHNYERGEKNGVRYAIVGGAGGQLDLERVAEWSMYDKVVTRFHYVVMEFAKVEDDREGERLGEKWRMKWEMWDLKGKVDEFVVWEGREG